MKGFGLPNFSGHPADSRALKRRRWIEALAKTALFALVVYAALQLILFREPAERAFDVVEINENTGEAVLGLHSEDKTRSLTPLGANILDYKVRGSRLAKPVIWVREDGEFTPRYRMKQPMRARVGTNETGWEVVVRPPLPKDSVWKVSMDHTIHREIKLGLFRFKHVTTETLQSPIFTSRVTVTEAELDPRRLVPGPPILQTLVRGERTSD